MQDEGRRMWNNALAWIRKGIGKWLKQEGSDGMMLVNKVVRELQRR